MGNLAGVQGSKGRAGNARQRGRASKNGKGSDLERLAEDIGTTAARVAREVRRPLLSQEVSFARMRVLALLLENGPQRIMQLALLDQVAQPSMTIMVDGMEQLGWVERNPDPTDRRAVLVSLTPAGAAEVKRVQGIRSRALAAQLAEMADDDIDQLQAAVDAFHRLVEHIKE
jgi:DNA-binding MarR family transcriptional regulator